MKSIDFDDFEPGMDTPDGNTLATCEYFTVDQLSLQDGDGISNPQADRFSILTVVSGTVKTPTGTQFSAGDFLLLPRHADPLVAHGETVVLQTTIPTK